MNICRSFGNPVKVDETTLKKEMGYYARVLVETDLSKAIPSKVQAETKYCSFEQAVQIPNIPKFCSHFSVIGHYVTECRYKRKEKIPQQDNPVLVKTTKVWRKVNNKQKNKGFDICFTAEELVAMKTSSHQEFPGLTVDQVIQDVNSSPSLNFVAKLMSPMVFVAEPKVSVTFNSCKEPKFPNMHRKLIHNSTSSKKGNIWVFWSLNISAPSVISISSQAITVDVGGVSVTVIHGACLTVDRRDLWEELEFINSFDKPWLSIGDFNTIMYAEEKKGGRSPLTISMNEFNNCLNTCGLIASTRRIVCNLDRVIYNAKWLDTYPGWNYKVMARGTLDHNALIGENAIRPKPENVPFRGLKNWNIFGDVRIKLLNAEKEVVQADNIALLDKLVVARRKKEILLQQSNEIAQQKARVQWLKECASNSKFFHTSIKIRQSHNTISELENSFGNIVSTQKEIADTLVEHFDNKFKYQEVRFADGIFDNIPKIINEADNKMLNVVPTNEEIYLAFQDMDPESAPGPDGFAGWLYRSTWDIIGSDLCLAIQYCSSQGFIPKGMNANFLTLIPKVQGAKKAS
ncbi:uncharacterized protein LOC113334563 [Papaver somniferum]|uniref:uncharacterized protein LOC113334563 n=1 Tax=Papaver somniferum TaxID=3469 RepID=UPI000E6FBDEB|nr:uncharacterized protein LOC113334563 [Papaver somniferum]